MTDDKRNLHLLCKRQKALGLADILPGDRAVGVRILMLDVIKNQIGLFKDGEKLLLSALKKSRRIDTGMDTVFFAQGQHLEQKIRLHQRFSARKGHSASRSAVVG